MSKNNDYINDAYISECCGASIVGEVTGNPPIGICSQCNEWAGVELDPDFEEKDND